MPERTPDLPTPPGQDRPGAAPRLAATASAVALDGPRVAALVEPRLARATEVATVGELMEALKGLDPSTPFVRTTEGHFPVTHQAAVSLVVGGAQPTKPGKWGPEPDGEPIQAVALALRAR